MVENSYRSQNSPAICALFSRIARGTTCAHRRTFCDVMIQQTSSIIPIFRGAKWCPHRPFFEHPCFSSLSLRQKGGQEDTNYQLTVNKAHPIPCTLNKESCFETSFFGCFYWHTKLPLDLHRPCRQHDAPSSLSCP